MAELIFPTFQELYDIAKDEIKSKDTTLNDFNEGSVLDVHCGSTSVIGTELIYQLGRVLKAFYITTAEGSDLDARLLDYGIVRKSASYAVGTITITRTGTGVQIIPAQSTFKCSVDGTEFYNENDIVFVNGVTSVSVSLTAKVGGTSGNVLANTINTISPVPSFAVTITHSAFLNGIDEETDTELRTRFYLELQAMSRGTEAALRTIALRYVGISNAAVQKIHSGYCRLYVDSGSGTPSSELIAQIQTEVDANWRAAGESVVVMAAQTTTVDITCSIEISSTYISQSESIISEIKEKITSLFNSKGMGESIYRSEIVKTVMSISGVVDITVTTPTENIVGQASKIIRVGVITIVTT